MAQIATRDTLVQRLNSEPATAWPHVWVNSAGQLVAGEFPRVSGVFDFGSERFRAVCEVIADIDNGLEVAGPSTEPDQKPNAPKKRVSLLNEARRRTERYEIETQEAIFEVGSATQALIKGLEIIEDISPGTLEKLSQEKGRTKRPVSRIRDELYDLSSQARYSHQLSNGYWVATNNKADEAIRFVKRAIDLAGLDGGVTVRKL